MRDLPLSLDLEVALGTRLPLHRRRARHAPRRPRARDDDAGGTLIANGTIRAVAGTYVVFGQRLDIDRGRLMFDGPVDNPALDVVALRKNIAVEAGVELTGTVKVPRVRLVSNPPVPDDEKLSWLLTGQGLERASRNDIALLAAASASLLGERRTADHARRSRNTIGLDDISVRDSGVARIAGAARRRRWSRSASASPTG